MMKRLHIALLILLPVISQAQFIQGEQLPIDLDIQNPRIVRFGDIDGDGDGDVVSGYFGGLHWYENINGLGVFSSPNTVVDGLGQIFGATVSDLDGDGDLDLTATSFNLDEVYWFRNLDGLGTFSSPILVSDEFNGPTDIITVDLDGDGDLDIVVNSDVDDILSWFENTDGQGTFGSQQIITANFTNGRSVIAGDIDGDGDLDLASASRNNTTIVWFENLDGLGDFNSGVIVENSGDGIEEIRFFDVDNDGDLDILAAIFNLDTVAWFENQDGLGDYGPRQVISSNLDAILAIDATDIDNDGDQDLVAIAGDLTDGGLYWFENLDGGGTFNTGTIIDQPTVSARSVIATDIDGDGDMDVIAPILFDDILVWYENQTVLSVEEQQLVDINVFPNPVRDFLRLEFSQDIIIDSIKMHDILGREVLSISQNISIIDLRHLQKGVYFMSVNCGAKEYNKRIIVN